VASTVWGVEDLVIENGEVEGQTETDRVGWSQVGLSDIGSVLEECQSRRIADVTDRTYLVGVVGGSGSALALLTTGELGKVTVVVTLPV